MAKTEVPASTSATTITTATTTTTATAAAARLPLRLLLENPSLPSIRLKSDKPSIPVFPSLPPFLTTSSIHPYIFSTTLLGTIDDPTPPHPPTA